MARFRAARACQACGSWGLQGAPRPRPVGRGADGCGSQLGLAAGLRAVTQGPRTGPGSSSRPHAEVAGSAQHPHLREPRPSEARRWDQPTHRGTLAPQHPGTQHPALWHPDTLAPGAGFFPAGLARAPPIWVCGHCRLASMWPLWPLPASEQDTCTTGPTLQRLRSARGNSAGGGGLASPRLTA